VEIINFEPIKGCKHPFIASGLLLSGALIALPDDYQRNDDYHITDGADMIEPILE
jgi:hypothetical protein